jgi:hypothetical protein
MQDRKNLLGGSEQKGDFFGPNTAGFPNTGSTNFA